MQIVCSLHSSTNNSHSSIRPCVMRNIVGGSLPLASTCLNCLLLFSSICYLECAKVALWGCLCLPCIHPFRKLRLYALALLILLLLRIEKLVQWFSTHSIIELMLGVVHWWRVVKSEMVWLGMLPQEWLSCCRDSWRRVCVLIGRMWRSCTGRMSLNYYVIMRAVHDNILGKLKRVLKLRRTWLTWVKSV